MGEGTELVEWSYHGPGCPVTWLAQISLFVCFLAAPHGLQDLSTLTRDQTQAPGSGGVES